MPKLLEHTKGFDFGPGSRQSSRYPFASEAYHRIDPETIERHDVQVSGGGS